MQKNWLKLTLILLVVFLFAVPNVFAGTFCKNKATGVIRYFDDGCPNARWAEITPDLLGGRVDMVDLIAAILRLEGYTHYHGSLLTTRGVGSTAEFSTVKAHTGQVSAYLKTNDAFGTGAEGSIILEIHTGAKLSNLMSLSWWQWVVGGYSPHVDVKVLRTDGEADSLVFEYAYNPVVGHSEEGPPTYGTLTGAWYQTFSDDTLGPAVIDDTAFAWLSSGPPGPIGDPSFIAGTLAEWKAGTVDARINGDSQIVSITIEIDNWIPGTVIPEAYIDDVEINEVQVHWIP